MVLASYGEELAGSVPTCDHARMCAHTFLARRFLDLRPGLANHHLDAARVLRDTISGGAFYGDEMWAEIMRRLSHGLAVHQEWLKAALWWMPNEEMAEKALPASLPAAVREAKLPAVRQKILERLKSQQGEGQKAVSSTAPVRQIPPTLLRPMPPAGALPPPPPPSEARSAPLFKIEGVEVCGDEMWFADRAIRRQLREAAIEAHKDQKILVGAPEDEVKRICPEDGRVLGAAAVLRLQGAHLGGYGESDIAYAYRQLSRALHPDKNPDLPMASTAFHRLSQAADELRQSLVEQRGLVQRLVSALGDKATPEMLERPQQAVFAEATRLLSAVCGLAGEGKVLGEARRRSVSEFCRSSVYSGCQAETFLSQWFQQGALLELFASPAMRVAYDCAPKRHRAYFLCLLNRVVVTEATRCADCVRGAWSTIMQTFPELGLWREFRDQIKQRVWTLDAAEMAKVAEEIELAAVAALQGGIPEQRARSMSRERSRSRRRRKERKDQSRSLYTQRGKRKNGNECLGLAPGLRNSTDSRYDSYFEPYRERERQRTLEWESRWVKCDEVQASVELEKPTHDHKKNISENPETGQRVGRWARKWRVALATILTSGLEGAVSPTDVELRKLIAAMWKDIVSWAKSGGAGNQAERVLGLFRSDHQTARTFGREMKVNKDNDSTKAEWSFLPASDLILITGEGLVGMTVEGVFADLPIGHQRLKFADCFKDSKDRKRKATSDDQETRARRTSKWDISQQGTTVEPAEVAEEHMIAMGFPREKVREALRSAGGNTELAVSIIISASST